MNNPTPNDLDLTMAAFCGQYNLDARPLLALMRNLNTLYATNEATGGVDVDDLIAAEDAVYGAGGWPCRWNKSFGIGGLLTLDEVEKLAAAQEREAAR